MMNDKKRHSNVFQPTTRRYHPQSGSIILALIMLLALSSLLLGQDGIVNLSEDPGKWPPFVALRREQSPT
jgi:hypothetical protein